MRVSSWLKIFRPPDYTGQFLKLSITKSDILMAIDFKCTGSDIYYAQHLSELQYRLVGCSSLVPGPSHFTYTSYIRHFALVLIQNLSILGNQLARSMKEDSQLFK